MCTKAVEQKRCTPFVHLISASDSSGGAGMQQDVRTCGDLGAWPISSVTGITAQTFNGVVQSESVSEEIFSSQLKCSKEFPVKAVKIGAVLSLPILKMITHYVKSLSSIPIILDPVLAPTSGKVFYSDTMRDYMYHKLLPYVTVVTPNWDELARICGRSFETPERAATYLQTACNGSPYFYLKGGHVDGDIFKEFCVGKSIDVMEKERWSVQYTHGTGCTMSTATAINMAYGASVTDALFSASKYVTKKYEEFDCLVR